MSTALLLVIVVLGWLCLGNAMLSAASAVLGIKNKTARLAWGVAFLVAFGTLLPHMMHATKEMLLLVTHS